MTSRETPQAADTPTPQEAAAAETGSTPEELGHLVKGLDFSGVVAVAKDWDIPGYEEYDHMVGSREITIDGLRATVGWVSHRPGAGNGYKENETPEIKVGNPGGEDIVVVEGHLHAVVRQAGRSADYGPVNDWAVGRPGRPGFLQFEGGDSIWLSVAHIQHEPSWYVCFYPEEAPEVPQAAA